jgi:hypothetical protein
MNDQAKRSRKENFDNFYEDYVAWATNHKLNGKKRKNKEKYDEKASVCSSNGNDYGNYGYFLHGLPANNTRSKPFQSPLLVRMEHR